MVWVLLPLTIVAVAAILWWSTLVRVSPPVPAPAPPRDRRQGTPRPRLVSANWAYAAGQPADGQTLFMVSFNVVNPSAVAARLTAVTLDQPEWTADQSGSPIVRPGDQCAMVIGGRIPKPHGIPLFTTVTGQFVFEDAQGGAYRHRFGRLVSYWQGGAQFVDGVMGTDSDHLRQSTMLAATS